MKKRLDILLVEKGLAESIRSAQALIMAGSVFCGTKRMDKAGCLLKEEEPLSVKTKEHPFVSRGALKLLKGIEVSKFPVQNAVCMDVGCSTGGFTEVLLNNGAKRVYAVDVGYGQLAQKLRTDERVVVLERTNARHLTEKQVPEQVDMIVCDASFIHLDTVLERPLLFAKNEAFLIALIKPQFQAPKHLVEKGGIVRDTSVHRAVCDDLASWLNGCDGWKVVDIIESPIKGAEGNTEFLLLGQKKSS